MPETIKAQHLGDAVYVRQDHADAVVLTVDSHDNEASAIYLESLVLQNLIRFAVSQCGWELQIPALPPAAEHKEGGGI